MSKNYMFIENTGISNIKISKNLIDFLKSFFFTKNKKILNKN